MAGPWEKFQTASNDKSADGPWNKFQPAAAVKSPEEPGLLSELGDATLSAAGSVGRFVDKYTGAPLRAADMAAEKGENPIAAGYRQFGEDSESAPTGRELNKQSGLNLPETKMSEYLPSLYSEKEGTSYKEDSPWKLRKGGLLDFSPAGAAGAAREFVENPLNAAGPAVSAAGKLAETSTGSKALGLLGKAGVKAGETLSGVPAKEIETYAKNADEIKQMYKSSGGSTAEAADTMRSKFTKDISNTKSQINAELSEVLKGANADIDNKPILDAIDAERAKINKSLNPEDTDALDALKNKVKAVSNEGGVIAVKDANDLKKYMQDAAGGAYAQPGKVFNYAGNEARAAKAAGAVTRQSINEVVPSVKGANDKLAYLHDIEDDMNKNLVAEGKPEAALLAAGSGGNQRNALNLKKLGEATGTNMQGDAEKLAAMRTFGSPKFTPADTTGKSLLRTGVGAGLGYLAGHVPGAIVGSAITSPAAVRGLIDTGRFAGQNATTGAKTLSALNAARLAEKAKSKNSK